MEDVTYARTPEYGLRLLLEEGPWDEVYLDHDMGTTNIRGVVNILEELAYDDEDPDIGRIFVITANPVAASWMMRALTAYAVERKPFIACRVLTLLQSIDEAHNERASMMMLDNWETL